MLLRVLLLKGGAPEAAPQYSRQAPLYIPLIVRDSHLPVFPPEAPLPSERFLT